MEVRSKMQSNPNALPSPERSALADRDAMRLIGHRIRLAGRH